MAKNAGMLEGLWQKFRKKAPSLLSETEISMEGNRRLIVWFHKGVLCAEDSLVALDCQGFTLQAEGKNLLLEAVGPTGTLITGEIASVSFLQGASAKGKFI